jgi:hypothetical protein
MSFVCLKCPMVVLIWMLKDCLGIGGKVNISFVKSVVITFDYGVIWIPYLAAIKLPAISPATPSTFKIIFVFWVLLLIAKLV